MSWNEKPSLRQERREAGDVEPRASNLLVNSRTRRPPRTDRKRRRATSQSARRRPSPQARDAVLRLRERDGHEAGAVGSLNAHHDRLLALALGAGNPGLYVRWARHRLACDIKDDVARSQSLLRRRSIRIDADDGDALVAVLGRSDLDAERALLLRLRAVGLGHGLILLARERDLSRLFGAVTDIGQFDLVAGLERPDAAGEVRRVVNHLAVELGDHVAGLEACVSGRGSRHRLGDDRALGRLHSHALGHVLGDRLAVYAEIDARNDSA